MITCLLAAALCASAPSPGPTDPRVARVTINRSLEHSLSAAAGGHASALAAQVARLLRWEGDIIRNIHRGDALSVVWEDAGEPELVAINYEGSDIQLRAFRHADSEGILRFYKEGGKLVEPVLKSNPVPGYIQITETVQHGRGKRKHKGIDLKANIGTPIHLPFNATVKRINWSRRLNGNCVEVSYTDGTLARFLHLDSISKDLRRGQTLSAGTRIGTVGTTGRSSAPHLHYELRNPKNDAVVDPFKYHGLTKGALETAQRDSFANAEEKLERLMAPKRS